jgi:hypothetical protein
MQRQAQGEPDDFRPKNTTIRLDFERQQEAIGPPHLAHRKWLIDWADRNDLNIYADGLIVHTTLDFCSRLPTGRVRQLGPCRLSLTSRGASTNFRQARMLCHKRRRCSLRLFLETKSAPVDCSSANPPYRSAPAGATPRRHGAAQGDEFIAKLRAENTLAAGFVAIDPATGHIKAWVGSRDSKTDPPITWRKPGGNRLDVKVFFRRGAPGQDTDGASPTAPWRFPCRTAPYGVPPMHRSPRESE